jgi:hypothetical protein
LRQKKGVLKKSSGSKPVPKAKAAEPKPKTSKKENI